MRKYLFLFLSIFLTGCFQVKNRYFINTDGSGKVFVEIITPMVEFKEDKERKMERKAKEIMEKTKGVEVWKNVKYRETEEGKLYFSGVAYFKDINKLEINGDGLIVPNLVKENNQYILKLKIRENKKKTKKKKLSEEEIEEKIKKERKNYNQMKPILAGFLTGLKEEDIFYLPGEIIKFSNLKKNPDGSLSLSLKGEEILKILDEIMKDEKLTRISVMADYDENMKREADLIFNEKMFGEKSPIQIVFKPEKDLFNYEKEVKEAKKEFSESEEKLFSQKPLATGNFENIEIAGIKIVFTSDFENGIMPFFSTEGYQIALLGKFKGKVLDVVGGELEKAIADTGEVLLPETLWGRKINFPKLSKDKTMVLFVVNLKLPERGADKIKEISGKIKYVTGSKSEEDDIGIKNFKTGEKGEKFNSVIESIKKSMWSRYKYTLKLKMKIPKYKIKSVKFYDENGNLLKYEERGSMSVNNITTLTFAFEEELPQKGKITVEIYKDIKEYVIPFKVGNIYLPTKNFSTP